MKKDDFNNNLVVDVLNDINKIVEDLKGIRENKNVKSYKTLIDVLEIKLSLLCKYGNRKILIPHFFELDELSGNLKRELLYLTEWNKNSYSIDDSRLYRETSIIQSKFIDILTKNTNLIKIIYSVLKQNHLEEIRVSNGKLVEHSLNIIGYLGKQCFLINENHKQAGKTSECFKLAKKYGAMIYCETKERAKNLNNAFHGFGLTGIFVSGDQRGSTAKFIVDEISLKKYIELKFIQNLDIVTGFVYEYEGDI